MRESYQSQAEREMRAIAAPGDCQDQSPQRRPTRRQIYALASLLLEREGLPWPDSRDAAGRLLERLRSGR